VAETGIETVDRWYWSEQKETAARLTAEGQTAIPEIAGMCGVHQNTIRNWRRHKEFQARVVELTRDFAGDVQTFVHKERVGVAKESKKIIAGLWDVAENSKSGQARVAALQTLASIGGLTNGRGGAGDTNVNVGLQINQTDGKTPQVIEVVGYEKNVIDDPVGKRDVE
jgi:transposase-like protein